MAILMQVKRGVLANLTTGVLSEREIGYTTDTKEVFVGDGGSNPILIGRVVIDSAANRPSAELAGRVFYDTTNEKTFIDDGAQWIETSVTNLDDVADGTTYGKVKLSELTGGLVDQINDGVNATTAADVRDHVDDADYHHAIADGSTTGTDVVWSASRIGTEIDTYLDGVSWKEPVETITLTDSGLNPSAGDRYLINGIGVDGFTGQSYKIAEYTGTVWNFIAPEDNMVVFIKDVDQSYTYDLTLGEWIRFTGAGQLDAGVGLSFSGSNTIDVNMGAGITELPSDEIGVDIATNGGIELIGAGNEDDQLGIKVDATTGATVAPLSVGTNGVGVKVDTTTIEHDGSGNLNVVAGGIGAAQIDETDDFTFTGTLNVNTPTTGDNDTSVATTEFVAEAIVDSTNTAGDGIDITANAISVVADTTSTDEFLSKSIDVNANGVAIKVDEDSIDDTTNDQLSVPKVWGGDMQAAAQMWHEPGNSWYIGSEFGGEKWYRSPYNGVDKTQLPAQTWEVVDHGVLPIPTLSLRTGDVIVTSGAGNSLANIPFDEVGTLNGAPRMAIYGTLAPVISFTSPIVSGTLNTSTQTYAITGQATHDVSVEKVEYVLTGDTVVAKTDIGVTPAGTVNWATGMLSFNAGTTVVEVIATDDVGLTTSSTITLVVDVVNPAITILGPTAGATYDFYIGASLTFSGTAVDNGSGLDRVEWETSSGGLSGTATGTDNWSAVISIDSDDETVTFTAYDNAGNSSTDSVLIVRDTTNPVVEITSPTTATSYEARASSIVIAGTLAETQSGLSSLTYSVAEFGGGTLNGNITVNPEQTNFNILLPLHDEGANVITITATDVKGNIGTDSITIVKDVTAPNLDVLLPVDSGTAYISGTTVSVNGTVTDDVTSVPAGGVTYELTGATIGSGAFVITGGSFAGSLTGLGLGQTVVAVTAIDSVGNSATETFNVVQDTVAPVVAIDGPTQLTTYDTVDGSVTITGAVSDYSSGVKSVTCTLTGATTGTIVCSISGSSSIKTFNSGSIAINAGITNVAVSALDNALNEAIDNLEITRDNTAPVVTFTTAGGEAITAGGTHYTQSGVITVVGTVNDNINGVGVDTVNYQLGGLSSGSGVCGRAGSDWSETFVVGEGTTSVSITAKDTLNNTSVASMVTLVRDNTNPVPSINTPAVSPYLTNTSSVIISGDVVDDVPVVEVRYTVTGANAQSGVCSWNGTTFSKTLSLTSDGSNTIKVTAEDIAGNYGDSSDIIVTRDTTIPVTDIVLPVGTSGSYNSASNAVTVSGTITDTVGTISSANYSLSGPSGATGTGPCQVFDSVSFSHSFTNMPQGITYIDVNATDEFGNVGSYAQIEIVYDTINPTVAITSHTDGATTTDASIDLVANATDAESGIDTVTYNVDGGSEVPMT